MKVRLTDNFKKQLKKLDRSVSKRVYAFLDNLESLENPRSKGKALIGLLSGLWRYRVGDYRIICKIEDNNLIVVALEIGHRKHIYK